MKLNKAFDFRTAFIDLLLNLFSGICFLFMIAILLISVKGKTENEGVKKDAQLLITIEWDSKVDCDVDMWVRDPQGNIVFYQKKDGGVMHIDRDDLGYRGDTVSVIPGEVPDTTNEETWTLRGKDPGEFVANLHLYSCRDALLTPFVIGQKATVPVKFKLIKINPNYEVIRTGVVTLGAIWDEITFLNFTTLQDGSVIVDETLQTNLVSLPK